MSSSEYLLSIEGLLNASISGVQHVELKGSNRAEIDCHHCQIQ